jgi:hypothetical protein
VRLIPPETGDRYLDSLQARDDFMRVHLLAAFSARSALRCSKEPLHKYPTAAHPVARLVFRANSHCYGSELAR